MTYLHELPEEIGGLIRIMPVTEYATVSSAGVPIDTPLLVFTSADLKTIDVATAVAYPAKAERARKNPKVGLLIEGGPSGPVISIAGMAAVQDSDLQANLDRYAAEEILLPLYSPDRVDYQALTRHAIWYFARIIISVTPVRVRWWKSPADMGRAPQEWRAPANTVYPPSDPVPPGQLSEPPKWPQSTWQDLAQEALSRRAPGHLTLVDAEGFPLPIRAHEVEACDEGFRLVMPKSVPWSSGKATLSFEGREIFVGHATSEGAATLMRVERALPVLPLVADGSQVIQPKPDTKRELMRRLEHEVKRRNQEIPRMPPQPPEPTEGARLRAAATAAYSHDH